jgi:polygalacturonase
MVGEKSISFNISTQTGHILIKINDLDNLLVFINAPEINAPDPIDHNVVNVTAYTSGCTALVEQTENINKAIEYVHSTEGKDTLYFPNGVYLTDTIKIFNKKDLTIYLAEGCMLKCKLDPEAEMPAGIFINESSNIKIAGNGVYNHTGKEFFELCDYHKYADIQICPILIKDSTNVTLENITIKNGRMWNISCQNSDNISILNCKVITPPECCPEWTDGIDINGCQHVLIDNLVVYCNDDCFASGHYFDNMANRDTDDVVVKNMLGWNPRANAIRIGWDCGYDLKNYLFDNCHFIGPDDYAVMIHTLKNNKKYEKITLRNCTFANTEVMIGLMQISGEINEFELDNVSFDAKKSSNISIVNQLDIRNMYISGIKQKNIDEADITVSDVKHINFD